MRASLQTLLVKNKQDETRISTLDAATRPAKAGNGMTTGGETGIRILLWRRGGQQKRSHQPQGPLSNSAIWKKCSSRTRLRLAVERGAMLRGLAPGERAQTHGGGLAKIRTWRQKAFYGGKRMPHLRVVAAASTTTAAPAALQKNRQSLAQLLFP